MSDVEQFEDPAEDRVRALVAPTLDAYELRRLLIVAGCIACAAIANYAPSALPEHVPVAVGSAVLGVLLVLRKRARRSADEATALDRGAVESPRHALSIRGRRGSAEAMQSMAASISVLERQIEAYEKRLTSLSGRQSLLQVEAREKFAGFETGLTEIRDRHIELLRLLNSALAQHRQSLADLAE